MELAFDALVANSAPGLKLGQPKEFHDKLLRIRLKTDKLERVHLEMNRQAIAAIEKTESYVAVVKDHIEESLDQLRSLSSSLASIKQDLNTKKISDPVDEVVATIDKAERMLDGFDVVKVET